MFRNNFSLKEKLINSKNKLDALICDIKKLINYWNV